MTKAIVLLSGGLDSATALAWALSHGWECWCLSVDYGQRHSGAELDAAEEVYAVLKERYPALLLGHERAQLFLPTDGARSPLMVGGPDVPVGRSVEQIATGVVAPTYVPARNMILLGLAANAAARLGCSAIIFGANADDAAGYPDCTARFLSEMSDVLMAGMPHGAPMILAPFNRRRKSDVVKMARELNVPIASTWSCYSPVQTGEAFLPCCSCDACTLRAAAGVQEQGEAAP